MRHFFLLLALSTACRKATPPTEVAVEPIVAPVAATPAPIPDAVVNQLIEQFQKVRFDLDSAKLGENSMAALAANATILQRHPRIKIQIEGHADERGTSDYNLALGDRRARSVKTYLGEMGIQASRIEIVSYGEEVPEAVGNDETAWSANRRCEFRILIPDAAVQGTVAD